MPEELASLAEEVLALQSAFDPLNATMLGVPGYAHLLPDPTAEAHTALSAQAADVYTRANALNASDLSADELVTRDVVAQQADALVDRISARMADYTVSPSNYAGAAAMMLSLMPSAAVSSPQDKAAYLERLRAVPAYLEAVSERHRAGTAAGRYPVRTLVDGAVAHLDRYFAAASDDPLVMQADTARDPDFSAACRGIVDKRVKPGLDQYRRLLVEELRGSAREDDKPGICWLPDGAAAYAALVRVHTTTSRTPDTLHELGIEVLDALRDEYATVGQRLFGISDQPLIFERLMKDPSLRWRSGEDLLSAARSAIQRAESALPEWFGVLPRQECEVRPVPATEAPGAPMAYYYQPALDGSRPGVYYASTYKANERDRFISEVTAFHEGVPGHHMQLTIAIERDDLPLLRRLADINATIEGWALYAERLADEMGLYSGELARLGMLAMDSLRASRLVVDTGLHAHGWSRQQAVAFMKANTPLSTRQITEEVDRYIGIPAQALSYMTGRLEIQRMRADAERALGERFDLRAFHDVIMTNAPLPLKVLENVLGAWSKNQHHLA